VDSNAKRPGSLVLLVGLVLLVAAAGLFTAFVPIVDCPGPSHGGMAAYYGDCPRCGKERGGYQRITLLRRWFWRPTPEERAEFERERVRLEFILDEK